MKEKIALTLSIIQTLVLIAILVVLIPGREKDNGPHPVRGQLEAQTRITKPIKIVDTDVIWGKKEAPNTIVAFVDYQCPYCMDVYKNLKELDKDYIQTGKVKVIFRDFPLSMHAYAHKFAQAVECARKQDKFWPMVDLMLSGKEKPDSTSVDKWVEELKLDKAAFTACNADTATENAIRRDVAEAKTYGVRGTPALFINDEYHRGTMPASDIIKVLEGKKEHRSKKTGSCNQK
jgi:protein-disulfide isomerase